MSERYTEQTITIQMKEELSLKDIEKTLKKMVAPLTAEELDYIEDITVGRRVNIIDDKVDIKEDEGKP